MLMPTEKGKQKLSLNGFLFHKKRVNANGSTIWCCVEGGKKCQSTCTTTVAPEGSLVVQAHKEHTHLPTAELNAVKDAKQELRGMARQRPLEKLTSVVADRLAEVTPEIRENIKSSTDLKRTAANARSYQRSKVLKAAAGGGLVAALAADADAAPPSTI